MRVLLLLNIKVMNSGGEQKLEVGRNRDDDCMRYFSLPTKFSMELQKKD